MRFQFLSSFKKCYSLACAQYICHGDGDISNRREGTELLGKLRLGCFIWGLITEGRGWELCAQGIPEVKS